MFGEFAADDASATLLAITSTASFQQCSFQGLAVTSTATVFSAMQSSGLRLRKCTFAADNVLQDSPTQAQPIGSRLIGVDADSDVYSDVTIPVLDLASNTAAQSLPLEQSDQFAQPFLDATGSEFRSIVEVRSQACQTNVA